MKFLIKFSIPFLFLLLISTLYYGSFVKGQVKILYGEKRKTIQAPPYSLLIESTEKFKSQFQDHVNDQIIGKNRLLRYKCQMEYHVFNQSPFPQVVVKGSNNWLYYNFENNIDSYQGVPRLSIEKLEEVKRSLIQKKRWLNGKGIDFVLFIAPSKPEIYPEFLPKKLRHNKGQSSWSKQLVEYLEKDTSLWLVYPETEMQIAKQHKSLYYKHDSHWNFQGAYVGYKALQDFLHSKSSKYQPAFQEKDFNSYKEERNEFDLLLLINLGNPITLLIDKPSTPDSIKLIKREGSDYKNYSPNSTHFISSNIEKAPKALIFRDSYAHDLTYYLSCNYSKSVYVWTPLIYSDIIEKEKPDVVILEIASRFINDLWIPNDEKINLVDK
ncbi:MAG: alginate O-acetyltransferase AlgX-related protein [Salibacteraceae bacterium]